MASRWTPVEKFDAAMEAAVPGCHAEENGDGEIVIYTGLCYVEDNGKEYVRQMTQKEIEEGVPVRSRL